MQLKSISAMIEQSANSNRFPWKIGLFLYTICYGFMFGFLDALFWDDWFVNFKFTDYEAHQYWKEQLGFFPTNRFIEISLLGRDPVLFHMLTFLVFFMIPVAVFSIAKNFKLICPEQRFYLVIILLILPINSARVSMACFRLSYSLLVFFVAWVVLVHPRTHKIKYFSVPLFVFSFLAQPLIPFFFLPVIHNWYIGHNRIDKRWKTKTLMHLLLLGIAPIYLLVAWVFSPPAEERRDYFTPGLSGLTRAFLLLALVLAVFIWSVNRKNEDQQYWRMSMLFALSLLFIGFGSAAYVASGRLVDISEWILNFVPRASDWDSRHQLLLGVGISLLLSTFIMLMERRRRVAVFISITVICVALNVSMMQSYFLDALKQKEVISALSKAGDISLWQSVVVIDEAKVFNARGRSIRSYEWEQMIVKAGGNEKVSVISTTHPCPTDGEQEKTFVIRIEPTQGRLLSVVKREVGLQIQVESGLICE
jgi:hypothetical protein